jgi:hypothetical protein
MMLQDDSIADYTNDLQTRFGNAWSVVYSIDGAVRPGAEAGHERKSTN